MHKRRIPMQQDKVILHGKFLERYQLFNSATVLAIGVAAFLLFFVLVAITMIGSIETPDRLGATKSAVSHEKKRQ